MATQFRFDTDFQTKIIAICVRNEDALRSLLTIVEPEYFTSSILRYSWSIMSKHLTSEGTFLSPESLFWLLKKTQTEGKKISFSDEQIGEFKESVLSTNIIDKDFVLKEVSSFCKQAAYLMAISSCVDDIVGGRFDNVISKVMEVAGKDFEATSLGMDYFSNIGSRYIGGETRLDVLPTGLPLDKHWRGLGRKEIGLCGAPTGRGKTAMLLNIAYHAMRQNKNVLYISCELSEPVLAGRLDKIVMGNIKKLELFQATDLIMALRELQKELTNRVIIKEFPAGELTVPKLYSFIRNLEAQQKVEFDLICVDYIGEMQLPTADREDLRYKEVVTQLRGLTWKLESRIWTAHQTKQGSHGKAILLEDSISDSSGILKPIDIGFTMGASHIEFSAGFQRLFIIKNRFGPTNETEIMRFDGKTFRFTSATSDELQIESEKKEKEMSVAIFGGMQPVFD